MNIGGGEAADQLVRMMLSGSEVAVRLSGSAIKNVLALTMALAKKHKTISGKVNLAKMLKETRDVRRFAMSPEQYQQFRQRAGKQKILFSAIRDSDNKGKVVDVIMPVTEIDRANMIFERIRYTGQPEQARRGARCAAVCGFAGRPRIRAGLRHTNAAFARRAAQKSKGWHQASPRLANRTREMIHDSITQPSITRNIPSASAVCVRYHG